MKNKKVALSLFVVCICVLLLFIRFVWLGRIASGISDDELFYVLTAKSFFFTGRDLSQEIPLLSLTIPSGIYAPFARVPSILFSYIIGPSSLSLFTARLPYAILGILFAIVMYGIMEKLTDKKTALITGFITLMNPWNIMFFRTSFDTPVAVFFTFLTIYIVLVAKKWGIFLAYPAFIAALYSYIGTSTVLGIFFLPAIIYAWKYINKSKYFSHYLLLTLMILITWLFFFRSAHTQNFGSRLDEILTPTSNYVASHVNTERRLTIQTPLTQLLSNKITVFGRMFLDKYFGAFSPTLLFTNGEGRTTFSLYSHGLFYYIDVLFFIFGLYIIFKSKRTLFWLVSLTMLIAPIPAVFSIVGLSYTLRSSLLYPFMIMIISVGISAAFSRKNERTRLLNICIIFFLYSLLFLNFLNIYLFKNPIANSEGFGFSGRVLARYASLASESETDVYIIENASSRELFNQYIFYTNQYTQNTVSKIANMYLTGQYDWDTIHFVKCPSVPYPITSITAIKSDLQCPSYEEIKTKIVLPQISDNGSIYYIYHDTVCSSYELDTYAHDITFEDLDVEKLSREQFCMKYFVKPM